jgi:hypothetical protein
MLREEPDLFNVTHSTTKCQDSVKVLMKIRVLQQAEILRLDEKLSACKEGFGELAPGYAHGPT